MISVVLLVMRNQLSRMFVFRNKVSLYKTDQSIRMRILLVLEIETIVHFSNIKCSFMCIMLKNELFKIQEGPFVMHTLSDLYLRDPCVRGVCDLTVITLLVLYGKIDLESLLQHCIVVDFFLHC